MVSEHVAKSPANRREPFFFSEQNGYSRTMFMRAFREYQNYRILDGFLKTLMKTFTISPNPTGQSKTRLYGIDRGTR